MLPNTAPSLRNAPLARVERIRSFTVASSRRKSPRRTFLYSVEGLGKSSFAMQAEGAIFLAAERGLDHLDVQVVKPEPSSYEDVIDALDWLHGQSFKTLVIDTVDWLEPLIWAHVCRENSWKSLEDPGYGKGYTAALEVWRGFIARLERLWREKDMEIILLGHCKVKPFSNPSGPDYNRYVAVIHEKAYDLLKQWVDAVLFGQYEERGVEKKGKVKGVSTGQRLIYTERTAAWDAKNRFSLPPVLPLDYAEYAAAAEAGLQADPDELMTACLGLVNQLGLEPGAPERKVIEDHLESKRGNAVALSRVLNRLRVKVDEAAPSATTPAAQ